MKAALLKHPQNTDLEKVGSLFEELGELHHARVDEDGEGILGEQVGKPVSIKSRHMIVDNVHVTNLTMASACSPTLADLRPFSSSVRAAWDSDSELDTDIVRLSPIQEFVDQRVTNSLNYVSLLEIHFPPIFKTSMKLKHKQKKMKR